MSRILLCGVAAICTVACGVDTGADQASGTRAAALAACTSAKATGPWANEAFGAQTGRFVAELTATPGENPIDAVIGFSAGPASRFRDLAAIIRFNPDGVLDVRAGAGYRADRVVAYTAGTTYHFRLDIDVARQLYSVTVQNPTGHQIPLAQNYPFRSEQAQATQLDTLSAQVDSPSGAIEVCDLQITPIASTECPLAVAGGSFTDQSIGPPGEVLVFSDFVATPDRILDGVIGLSPRWATSFNDLAATVRFSPDGVVDAHNGGAYQADVALPYAPGEPRRVRIIANVPAHTFSAYVETADRNSVQLANRYAFRPTQSAATFLSDLNAINDSTQGAISICNAQHRISTSIRMYREGNYVVAPLPFNDETVIANATTTFHVTGDGRTLAQLDAGGEVAVDPAGNVYLARITGSDLVVEAYTPELALRWTRTQLLGENRRIAAIGADPTSVMVATRPIGGAIDRLKHWLTDGTDGFAQSGTLGDAIAVGPTGYALAFSRSGTVLIRKWTFNQTRLDWSQIWINDVTLSAMAMDPSGLVYLVGRFTSPINFGGPTIAPEGGASTFLTRFSAVGGPGFTRDISRSVPISLASNGNVIAMSHLISPLGARLRTFDSRGQDLSNTGQTGFGTSGNAGSVTVGPSDRVYWNFADTWPPGSSTPRYPHLISVAPGV